MILWTQGDYRVFEFVFANLVACSRLFLFDNVQARVNQSPPMTNYDASAGY